MQAKFNFLGNLFPQGDEAVRAGAGSTMDMILRHIWIVVGTFVIALIGGFAFESAGWFTFMGIAIIILMLVISLQTKGLWAIGFLGALDIGVKTVPKRVKQHFPTITQSEFYLLRSYARILLFMGIGLGTILLVYSALPIWESPYIVFFQILAVIIFALASTSPVSQSVGMNYLRVGLVIVVAGTTVYLASFWGSRMTLAVVTEDAVLYQENPQTGKYKATLAVPANSVITLHDPSDRNTIGREEVTEATLKDANGDFAGGERGYIAVRKYRRLHINSFGLDGIKPRNWIQVMVWIAVLLVGVAVLVTIWGMVKYRSLKPAMPLLLVAGALFVIYLVAAQAAKPVIQDVYATPGITVPSGQVTPASSSAVILIINTRNGNIHLWWRDESGKERDWSGAILPGDTWKQTSYVIPGTWVVKDSTGNVLKSFPAPTSDAEYKI